MTWSLWRQPFGSISKCNYLEQPVQTWKSYRLLCSCIYSRVLMLNGSVVGCNPCFQESLIYTLNFWPLPLHFTWERIGCFKNVGIPDSSWRKHLKCFKHTAVLNSTLSVQFSQRWRWGHLKAIISSERLQDHSKTHFHSLVHTDTHAQPSLSHLV